MRTRTLATAATVVVVLTSALVTTTTVAAHAADDAVSWSVAPADTTGPDGRSWVELTADPGEAVVEHLAIRNLGSADATFRITAADGYFTKTGRFNMLQSDQESVAAGTWITVDETVSIEAGGMAVIPFTVAVPSAATPGDHAAGIAASISTVGTTTEGTKIGVESRVGFRVMTRVTGELAPRLSVDDLDVSYEPSWNLFAPGRVSIRYTALNAGNTQLSFGENVGGSTVARGDLFVGEDRVVTVEPFTAWPLGPVTVEVDVTASVPTTPGLDVPPVTRSVIVWAIPWLHLATLAVLALLVVAVVASRRRRAAQLEELLEAARAEGRSERVAS